MTKRRVVADDIIGRIAVKQHELMRMTLEGTLSPDVVLENLQKLIEKKPFLVSSHHIERLPFSVSDAIHSMRIDTSASIADLAKKACLSVQMLSGLSEARFVRHEGPAEGTYQIVEVTEHVSFDYVRGLLEDVMNYEMTDVYELLAFARTFAGIKYPRTNFQIFALNAKDGNSYWMISHEIASSFPREFRPLLDQSGIKGIAHLPAFVLVRKKRM